MRDWAIRRRAIEDGRYLVSRAGRYGRWRGRAFRLMVTVLDVTLRLTPLHARGRRNALDLRKVELEVELPGLPSSFDGYRILQLSDTHLDHFPELAPAARALLDGIEVDMLAVTGDVHGHPRTSIEHSAGLLMEALAGVRVRGPRLAVLGNHDPAAMVGVLERTGFDVLVNRSIVVRHGGDSLCVTGLDDVHSFYTEAALAALGDHDGGFRIALVHSAEVADDADEAGYALYLCGHTHGGQICLPGGRPLVTHLKRCRHAASGLWRQGRMVGYTSRGVGVSDLPMRFNTRGEVVVITLRRPRA
ncbi:MAG: metallophosphoesterase family protein [Rhodospirillales bacterium]|nr:metallophosphoesterase family protein [Rhodospirillales bacterium]